MKRQLGFLLFIFLGSYMYSQTLGSLGAIPGGSTLKQYMPSTSQMQMMGIDPAMISSLLGLPKTNPEAPVPSDVSGALQGALTPEFIQQLLLQKSSYDSARLVSDAMALQRDSMALIRERMNIPKSDIFGHDFFGSDRLELFERTTDLKAPDDYILDTGDELNVSVWGYSNYNATLKVSAEGHVSNAELGRVYVRGMSFGAVKSIIRSRLASFVNLANSNVEVSVSYSRAISVNIVGEVNIPGTYRIPAINSVYNAINAAEGVTEIGSVRKIEVRRGGKTVRAFDLYNFLMNGTEPRDFYLQDGDFIYVPPAERIVDISGAVRRPKKYELVGNEQFPALINYAGGLAAGAYTQSVQVRQYFGDRAEIVEANLAEILAGRMPFELRDGDSINVPSIPTTFENFLTIEGAVRFPGKYEFNKGYRVSDLLKMAGGILYSTYLEKGFVVRTMDDFSKVTLNFSLQNIIIDENSPDNILLKERDRIIILDKSLFHETFNVSIKGSVKKEVTLEYTEGLTLYDLLYFAGGLKQEAAGSKIEITRLVQFERGADPDSLTAVLIPGQRILVKTIPITGTLTIPDEDKSYQLQPYDVVAVRKDFTFDSLRTVTLTGEVKFPGVYTILHKDEKMLDLIARAGGLTQYAHPQSARLFRSDLKLGNVILELADAFRDPESRANYILKANDQIVIPTVNQVVSIRGAVKYPDLDTLELISGRYVPGKRAKWYIKHYAGGFQKRAKRKSTLSLAPNGEVGYTKFVFFGRKYPKVAEGSVITVDAKPPKPVKEVQPREPLNWNIILPAVIASVASTVSTTVLYLVLRR